jgi:hypothetical protein
MVDIDIDIWRYGRTQNGRLDMSYLHANYPHVPIKNEVARMKVGAILFNHFDRNHFDQDPWLIRQDCVYFQEREDAELFRALLYIY